MIVFQLLGIAGLLCFGFFSFKVWLFPPEPLTYANTVEVSGILQNARIVRHRNGRSLKLSLQDESYTLNGSFAFPQYYHPYYKEMLKPGKSINARIEKKVWEEHKGEVHSYSITALKADGVTILNLRRYNESAIKNEAVGRIIAPVLSLFSLIVLYAAKKRPQWFPKKRPQWFSKKRPQRFPKKRR